MVAQYGDEVARTVLPSEVAGDVVVDQVEGTPGADNHRQHPPQGPGLRDDGEVRGDVFDRPAVAQRLVGPFVLAEQLEKGGDPTPLVLDDTPQLVGVHW